MRPTQCTLVPDETGAVTSDHGWDLRRDADRLRPIINELHGYGCRVSLFMDPNPADMALAKQLGVDRIETFRVLSAPESKAREVNYGADVGTLTLTVFPEGKAPAPDLAEDAAEKNAVAAAELPPAKSFDALKAKLLEDANRGLIAEGAQVEGKVEVVKFTPAATPVMTLTVIYYKAK